MIRVEFTSCAGIGGSSAKLDIDEIKRRVLEDGDSLSDALIEYAEEEGDRWDDISPYAEGDWGASIQTTLIVSPEDLEILKKEIPNGDFESIDRIEEDPKARKYSIDTSTLSDYMLVYLICKDDRGSVVICEVFKLKYEYANSRYGKGEEMDKHALANDLIDIVYEKSSIPVPKDKLWPELYVRSGIMTEVYDG